MTNSVEQDAARLLKEAENMRAVGVVFVHMPKEWLRELLDQLALLRQERDEARAQIADYPEVMKTLVAIKAAHLRRFDDAHAQLTALRSAIRSIAEEMEELADNNATQQPGWSQWLKQRSARLVILAQGDDADKRGQMRTVQRTVEKGC